MSQPTESKRTRTFSHWGSYDVVVTDGRITEVIPNPIDPNPSPIGQSFLDAVDHPTRITRPAIRQGWLEKGPLEHGGGRGSEPFTEVSWDRALSLAAAELDRVATTHGNGAIFGGSYGWASAGRFHHAQSQIHRFLNLMGGYTRSVNTYSHAAAEVIIPRVLGRDFREILATSTPWPVLAEHSELIVMFGGIPLKNAQVNSGGVGRHTTRDWMKVCRSNCVEFVNVSPLSEDADEILNAEWLAVRPNSDTALMLGLAHTIVTDGRHNRGFLDRYTTGYDRFEAYLLGTTDGQPKDASWAADLCGTSEATIISLARRMVSKRTMITVSWSLQRGDHGEQPYWMAVTLAAILGQIGLPGGGVGFGYGSEAAIGSPIRKMAGPALDQGTNPVKSFIPVARITDMLLNPGGSFEYDGQTQTYPDARLIYWAGGNPFHHHQDLNKLTQAWQRPETVIVNEPWWNSLARHADIVFPATTALERDDIAGASTDDYVFAMEQAIEPIGEARSDYEIFAGLADELGFGPKFTERRSADDWIRHLYETFASQAESAGIDVPDFDGFWDDGELQLPVEDSDRVLLADFRADPDANRLGTPSGLIELFSETIDSFGYADCPGHATWLEPSEWLGGATADRFPIHLVSNQPKTRLHSQLDVGKTSTSSKVAGREPVMIHPDDAASRGITDGSIVRLFNERGECLAGAVISDHVMPGAVVLPTGAWYDPAVPGGLERHGNPNVLTRDKGTSSLAQGPTAHTTMIEIELFTGEAPDVGIHTPPEVLTDQ